MSLNVLIVDDSPSMRKVIRRILALSGIGAEKCLEAGDGFEALQVLRNEPVDIVLTDINMPNMNGEQLIGMIAIDPLLQGIPVVVVSTDRSEDRLQAMLALGARAYVTKPFVPETLGAELNRVLGEARRDYNSN
jgi:two-component system chemotaxis response regulator CheY